MCSVGNLLALLFAPTGELDGQPVLEFKADFTKCRQKVGTQYIKDRRATCRIEVKTYSTYHKKVPMCTVCWGKHKQLHNNT